MQFLTLVVTFAVDPVPDDNDVKAGWLAFAIFIALVLAVAFLGFSLVKQLRKAQAAEDAGLYDPSDKKPAEPLPTEQPPTDRSTGQPPAAPSA